MDPHIKQRLLVDNGSLKPEAYLNLCRVADALSERLNAPVHPVSLGHSDRIAAELLGGRQAWVLEAFIEEAYSKGCREFEIVPFILAPQGGIADLMGRKLDGLRDRFEDAEISVTHFLFEESSLLPIIEARIDEGLAACQWERPALIVVDHGSPKPEATHVRDTLARELGMRMKDRISAISPASMESRSGRQYAFNKPLLKECFEQPSFNTGCVIVAMLFLSPGAHAGPDGDVAQICNEAVLQNSGLKIHITGLLGTHPAIIPALATLCVE